jgi:hypothetical protein
MSSTNSDPRCQHKTANGKRCRMLRAVDHPAYCSHHAGWLHDDKPPEDLTPELLGPLGDFRSMAAVNYALGKLALLVASRRIPTREAATLGYLFQFLLQTVPGVNHEISRTEIDRTNGSDGLRHVLAQTASLVQEQN